MPGVGGGVEGDGMVGFDSCRRQSCVFNCFWRWEWTQHLCVVFYGHLGGTCGWRSWRRQEGWRLQHEQPEFWVGENLIPTVFKFHWLPWGAGVGDSATSPDKEHHQESQDKDLKGSSKEEIQEDLHFLEHVHCGTGHYLFYYKVISLVFKPYFQIFVFHICFVGVKKTKSILTQMWYTF